MAASTVEFSATPNGLLSLFSPFGPLSPPLPLLEGELHATANEPTAAVAMAPRRSVRLSREPGRMVISASSLIDWICTSVLRARPAWPDRSCAGRAWGVVAVVSEPRCGADDQLSDAGATV